LTEDERVVVTDTGPCIGCGMCCDGTLYWRVKVRPGEEEQVRSHGLPLTDSGGRTYFRLPCQLHAGSRCTIYESRPGTCRRFRCQLLRKYEAGEVGAGEARRRVETVLALVAAVKADDPLAANAFERRTIRARLVDAPEGETPEERRIRAKKLLNIIALDTCLEQWFRNQPPDATDQAPGTSGSNSEPADGAG